MCPCPPDVEQNDSRFYEFDLSHKQLRKEDEGIIVRDEIKIMIAEEHPDIDVSSPLTLGRKTVADSRAGEHQTMSTISCAAIRHALPSRVILCILPPLKKS